MAVLNPEEIDSRLNWPAGKAARLARRGKLPHYVLPDGSIRFKWEEIEPLLKHVEAEPRVAAPGMGGGGL